ncbi:bifunctional precorrin-2 dehydrogenase/sirohydrochlorin ferrochelatase [Altererythrobacter aquiaggeris]|uniref:precorrin-2 dehydrogenase/sirohydrochlorin ferrochelatase family protein n=1 Tax=Aestuarierythrobacter aquiaggeris TaxID=1898396 RepID=UPI003019000E
MKTLPLFHKIAGTKVVVLGDGEEAAAKRRLVENAGGICVGEPEAHQAKLAFVGIEDEAGARAAALRLGRMGLLVNVVDRPALCEFTTPALVDRDPVLIAVGTGGASAGLAKHIRLRLEALLPARLGDLANALSSARSGLREKFSSGADRRQALDHALAEGGPLDPLQDVAADAVKQWLENADAPQPAERLTITVASDDPDELTLRQARLLGRADTIIFGPEIPPAIVARARADAARISPAEDAATCQGLTVVIRRA